MIFRNTKGQMTGELIDGVYVQNLKKRVHSFHSRGELAIDTKHLKALKQLGAFAVKKTFADTKETFTVTVEKFIALGYEKTWTDDDGAQTFLNEKHWTYKNDNQIALF